MHKRSFLRWSVAIGTVGLAGCGQYGDGGDATRRTVALSGPPCESADGATFESVEEQADGPVPGGGAYWTVTFEDGQFEYSHTDVFESGTYTCTVEDGAAELTGNRETAPDLTGTYDPETGVLQWDGVRYRPVESGD